MKRTTSPSPPRDRAATTGRWARALCGVGCGLAFVLAVFSFFLQMAVEPAYEIPLSFRLPPFLFFVAAIIAFMAIFWMRTSSRVGGVLALVAALVCLPSVFVQEPDVWIEMTITWLIAGAPLLIASALAFRAARRMGSG